MPQEQVVPGPDNQHDLVSHVSGCALLGSGEFDPEEGAKGLFLACGHGFLQACLHLGQVAPGCSLISVDPFQEDFLCVTLAMATVCGPAEPVHLLFLQHALLLEAADNLFPKASGRHDPQGYLRAVGCVASVASGLQESLQEDVPNHGLACSGQGTDAHQGRGCRID